MRTFLALCLFAVATIGLAMSDAQAARVTPMAIQISPTGRNSIARIEVTNSEDRLLPVEIRMYRGIVSESGELEMVPADDRFVVFPPQITVQPRSQQAFRIQYLADGPMERSEIYYASVTQLPVDLEPGESRIQVLMRFNVLVEVVPEDSRSAATVSWSRWAEREYEVPVDDSVPEAEQVMRRETVAGIEFRIQNDGTRSYPAGRNGLAITGTAADGAAVSRTLSAEQLAEVVGLGLVPAGGARIFFLPFESRLQDSSLSVTLN